MRKAKVNTAGPILKKKRAKGTPSAALERVPNAELSPVRSATRSCPGGCGAEVRHGQAAGGPSAQCRPPSHSGPAKPDCIQFNGAPGPRHGRFLGQTQKIYPPGQSVTGVGGHSFSEVAQAVLGTSFHG